jgi:hypothetical protein
MSSAKRTTPDLSKSTSTHRLNGWHQYTSMPAVALSPIQTTLRSSPSQRRLSASSSAWMFIAANSF